MKTLFPVTIASVAKQSSGNFRIRALSGEVDTGSPLGKRDKTNS